MTSSLGAGPHNYYEHLATVDEGNKELWETLMGQRDNRYIGADPVLPVNDFRFYELRPDVHLWAYNTDFQTNRWGMRDQDYALAKPAGTLRIALLGSSHVMGWGIGQEAVFETLLEDRLNSGHPPGTLTAHVEILNFAVYGYSPLGQLAVLQNRIRAFSPDIVLFVAHSNDFAWLNRDLSLALRQRIPIPYEYLRQTLVDARVVARTHETLASGRLKPFEPALGDWTYTAMAEECRAMGALPIYVFLPVPSELSPKHGITPQLVFARQAGFIVVDLSNVYDQYNPQELILEDDVWQHSNAKAHSLIADALYTQLMTDPRIELVPRVRPTSLDGRVAELTTRP